MNEGTRKSACYAASEELDSGKDFIRWSDGAQLWCSASLGSMWLVLVVNTFGVSWRKGWYNDKDQTWIWFHLPLWIGLWIVMASSVCPSRQEPSPTPSPLGKLPFKSVLGEKLGSTSKCRGLGSILQLGHHHLRCMFRLSAGNVRWM